MRLARLLAVVLVAVAGCGDNSHPAAPSSTAAPASALCGDAPAGARTIRFRTRDGVALTGDVLGSGPAGAVLIHQYPQDRCGWLPYAS